MIPFNTTTIRVESPDAADDSGDPYASDPPPAREVWADDVRAVITARLYKTVTDAASGGDAARLILVMSCDPCKIDHRCKVVDKSTGVEYEVVQVFRYTGTAPLDYVKVHLEQVDNGGVLNDGRT